MPVETTQTAEAPDTHALRRLNNDGRSMRINDLKGSIVFDIETSPLDDETIFERSEPFEPPMHPGEFDPSLVRTGNLKDQNKIADKIDSARQAHAQECERFEASLKEAEQAWRDRVIDRSTLSPLTSRVCAIGLGCGELSRPRFLLLEEDSDSAEYDLLVAWWAVYSHYTSLGHAMIGHNISGFDIPFLLKRSWLLDCEVPPNVLTGRYLNHSLVDTIDRWKCGNMRSTEPAKLDFIARVLGIGQKTEGMDGACFHGLYWSDDTEDFRRAMEYLATDVELTLGVAERLGLL